MTDKLIQIKDADGNNLFPNIAPQSVTRTNDLTVNDNLTATGQVNANSAYITGNVNGNNVIGRTAVYEGGTATANKLENRYLKKPTMYTATTTTTSTSSNMTKTWKVNGSGYVLVTVFMKTDGTNSWGTNWANIEYDGAYVGMNSNRYTSNWAYSFGVTTTVLISVANGKNIICYSGSSKDGTKTSQHTLYAFGCTLTAQ